MNKEKEGECCDICGRVLTDEERERNRAENKEIDGYGWLCDGCGD